MPKSFSLDSITDEGFRARFLTVPKIISSWVEEHRNLKDLDIMDFGCGEGVSALAMALNFAPRGVVGVDIMPDPERCLEVAHAQLGITSLPDNLHLHRVKPGALHAANAEFDLIYSWSTFEHVDQNLLESSIALLRSSLRRNGLLFIQIAPLFYSAAGAHLSDKIADPWVHLLTQHSVLYDKLAAVVADQEERRALWSTYRTLNRLTSHELIHFVEKGGFKILRQHQTKDSFQPPARLKAIFNEDVLRTNQIVILARAR